MKKSRANRSSREKGFSLVEFAASLALFLPVLIAVLYVTLEASYGYTIKANLDASVRKAARALSIEYGKNPTITTDSTAQGTIFDTCKINNFVNDKAQFSTPTFDTTTPPGTVTLTVTYTSGSYGLPTFPNPDPLNLGPTFVIKSTSTYSLE